MACPSEAFVDAHVVVRGIVKTFGNHVVLRDAHLIVRRGETAVVIGKSGSGKTTLLKIMGSLEKPTAGQVLVGGVDLVALEEKRLNEVRRRIGMVFQYSALLDWMTVFENVAFPLREHAALPADEILHRVSSKLDVLGLSAAADQYPAELSGGMRKRVALARALILDPEVVMYDEPTSGLDPVMARVVDELILSTRDRFGVTSVVISHDMAAAMRVADRVHLLADGRIVASGPPRDLLSGRSEWVREFIDSSAIDADRLLRERAARVPSSRVGGESITPDTRGASPGVTRP
ncbi:MAG: ABC transporter ATP-binding protein [Polyangiaceae bacterium]